MLLRGHTVTVAGDVARVSDEGGPGDGPRVCVAGNTFDARQPINRQVSNIHKLVCGNDIKCIILTKVTRPCMQSFRLLNIWQACQT